MLMDSTSGDYSPHSSDAPLDDDVPRFGALDIVEAFTAMRHEWRSQTKESHALAEQIQAAVANLQSMETKLLARVADNRSGDDSTARQFALRLVETDQQLSRAIAAIAQYEATRKMRDEADVQTVEQYYMGMSALARWFAQPLLKFVTAQRSVAWGAESPAIEGLNLVLARLRRALADHGIERIETEGQPFSADMMRAIGTVEAADCPSGHVAEQLSPGYRWQERMLCFADVRVAK
jgi:molecular chaperone GrpE